MMFVRTYVSRSEADTEAIGRMLALWIRPAMAVFLSGDLGTGKSVLARAIIRAVAGEPDLDVPSPTFAIAQTYDDSRVPLLHADLYRLSHAAEIEHIGLTDLMHSHAAIVEWPDLLSGLVNMSDVLEIAISGHGLERTLSLKARGHWASALRRNEEVEAFLERHGASDLRRQHYQGDASTRRYELLHKGLDRRLLMDMPERTDHRIVRQGKSYSELVHLADKIDPVFAINRFLSARGYRAPEILQCDFEKGLALIEYLDGITYFNAHAAGFDLEDPMRAALDVLADMCGHDWPARVPVREGAFHLIHAFDVDAQLAEVELMPMWFWPWLHQSEAPADVSSSFEATWRGLIAEIPHAPVWMLRDFHSVNLIWMPREDGFRRVGLIDTQDAVMGHPAYDVVSLIQDARHDVPHALQENLLRHYLDLRRKQPSFDEAQFLKAYAITGAQRATRLLGTFTRLSVRDGKHHYLQHRPRNARYLLQNLEHESLAPLRDWYRRFAPEVLEIARS
jgi:N-acetylmuramate 1-kinase